MGGCHIVCQARAESGAVAHPPYQCNVIPYARYEAAYLDHCSHIDVANNYWR